MSRADDIARATRLYRSFRGHDPTEVISIPPPRLVRTGLLVGSCDGILYTTERDGKVEKYIHKFARSDRPYFAVSPDGLQILLLGGRFRFTERGIVDRSDRSG